jgi:hypothetical protein
MILPIILFRIFNLSLSKHTKAKIYKTTISSIVFLWVRNFFSLSRMGKLFYHAVQTSPVNHSESYLVGIGGNQDVKLIALIRLVSRFKLYGARSSLPSNVFHRPP